MRMIFRRTGSPLTFSTRHPCAISILASFTLFTPSISSYVLKMLSSHVGGSSSSRAFPNAALGRNINMKMSYAIVRRVAVTNMIAPQGWRANAESHVQ